MTSSAERPSPAQATVRGELQYYHVTIAFLATIAVFFLVEPLYKSTLSIYLGYNGGWNAYHALHAMRGENIYALPNPLITNNYPPASFYIVGLFGKITGDNIVAGRIVALLAFFVIAVNIAVVTFKICRDRAAATFAGVFFVATMAGIYDMYIGINDPQMLGHAFMTTGLAVLIGSETRRRNLFLSALLICAGGFVKHNLVALPVAVAIYLFFRHRHAFFYWAACAAGMLVAAFGTTLAVFGTDFIDSLTGPRRFTAFRLGKKMLSEPLRLQIPIVFWALYSSFTFKQPYTFFLGIYVLISGTAAILFSGGAGVAINVFFDLVIGLSIAVGIGLQWANERLIENGFGSRRRLALMTVLAFSLCFGIVVHVPVKAYRLARILPQLPTIESETAADIEYLSGLTGPVLCETLALCYMADKPFEVDTFYSRQLFLAGTEDESVLIDKVNSGYYAAIQLVKWEEEPNTERISPELMETVQRCYWIARISANGAYFVPNADGCNLPPPAEISGEHANLGWAGPVAKQR